MLLFIFYSFIFDGIKDFTNIPSPLALGGLIVGALLLIFLTLLKLGIFPMLGRGQAGTLLGDMMKYLFVLALVGLVLAFVGFVLPIIGEMIKGKTVTDAQFIPAPTPTVQSTPSIQVPPNKGYTLEIVITKLAQDGHGAPIFKNNCTEEIKKARLKPGLIGAPDVLSLINKLQYNLEKPAAEKIYDATLTKEGSYEIDCQHN